MVSLLAVRVYPKNLINPKQPSPTPPPAVLAQKVETEKENSPEHISIPSLNISLEVAPAIIADNKWTLYEDKVSWLITSKTPGDGNVILYAHNRENLFGGLKDLEPGEKIIVSVRDKNFNYKVVEKRKVLPSDVDAVISSENQLTLYTCDGSFDEKRLIIKAEPLTEQPSGVILE